MNYKFTIDKQLALENPNKVVDIIREFGICFIPSFLEGEDLAGFQQEVFQCFEYEKLAASYSPGRACRMKTKDKTDIRLKYPMIYKTFCSDWQYDIYREWIDRSNFSFAEEIFLTEETNVIPEDEWSPNMFTHVDKTPTCKSFIYVNDVTVENGAFHCIPGSQVLGERVRQNALKETSDYAKIRNKVKDYPELAPIEDKLIPIEGSAGSMFFFHSSMFHFGGFLKEEGTKRVIARSHSR